jgi:hypothetical protein
MPSHPKHQKAFEQSVADARSKHQLALEAAKAVALTHPDRHHLAKLVAQADAELNAAMAKARAKLLAAAD